MTQAASQPSRGVGHAGISLFRVAGIRIQIDYSWFLIFLLVLWSLSVGYFPQAYPDQSAGTYWAAGLLATLLFFASIVAHELAHSLVALRAGIRIPAITLFLFGGVSHMEQEPSRPGTEVAIAVVGPLTSFALALGFWALEGATRGDVPELLSTVFHYLFWINAALGVFNLIPGFPLDGGRVLRALVWWRTGSLSRATKVASDAGKGFAVGLMVLGAFSIFSGGLVGGLWLILIGMFLRGVAGAGYQSLAIRRALEDFPVERIMIRDVVTVDPGTSIRRLVDDYFLAYGYHGFPVLRDGRVRGLISLAEAKEVPEAERDRVRVEERMVPLDEAIRIGPQIRLTEALERMSAQNQGRLLVMRGDELLGLLTRTGLARFVEFRNLLDEEG